jgi:radical SAM protein with 4Fe4S-binding SPASM domain
LKLIDNIKKEWNKFEHEQLSEVAEFPRTLMLEVTNSCNLSCIMCKNPKMIRKKGFISLDLVKKIADEAIKIGIEKIALYTTGESLLHKDIIKIIKIFKEKNFYVYITTNATLFGKQISIEEFLKSGIDSIKYSFDGLNKQEYESIRINGKYETVFENIKSVKKIRDELNIKTKLLMGIILNSNNLSYKEKFIRKYGKYVDEILFSTISNQGGHIKNIDYAVSKQKFKPCRQLWDRIVVTYDGKLVACCIDFESELIYDDITFSSFEKAWNNNKIQEFRREHIKHNFKKMTLCKGCDSPYIQQSSILDNLNE